MVDRWLADHAGGLTPNPCVRCNGNVRLDAMLELAERLGSRDARDRPLRARAATKPSLAAGPLLRMAADEAKDQSYVLAALAPRSLARLRFPLGELRKAAGARARRARRPGGRAQARLAGSVLSGGHASRRLPRAPRRAGGARPGAIVDRGGQRARRARAARTRSPSVSATGSALGGREPLYVLATDAHANTVTVGPREELLRASVSRARGDAASRRRAAWTA